MTSVPTLAAITRELYTEAVCRGTRVELVDDEYGLALMLWDPGVLPPHRHVSRYGLERALPQLPALELSRWLEEHIMAALRLHQQPFQRARYAGLPPVTEADYYLTGNERRIDA